MKNNTNQNINTLIVEQYCASCHEILNLSIEMKGNLELLVLRVHPVNLI